MDKLAEKGLAIEEAERPHVAAIFEARPSVNLGPMGFPESWKGLLA